jgi:enoyl-CoA hydratase/carnithine racemase
MESDLDSAEPVLFEKHGFVGVIYLNQLAHRNALCADLVEGVLAALEESRKTNSRAIVLTSTGKAFCAGADMNEALESGWLVEGGPPPSRKTPFDLFEALEADSRPIIAAVNGLALGGGVELVLACDLAIATDTAKFALPEISLGVIPNTAMARLPYLVGQRKALELILTRRRFDAAEAKDWGLISEVLAPEDLTARAIALAESICAACPPGAIAAVKQGMKSGPGWPQIKAMLSGMREEEWREGFSAFSNKHTPDYERFWNKP